MIESLAVESQHVDICVEKSKVVGEEKDRSKEIKSPE